MEVRRLGRLGHNSSVAIFGACALGNVPQDEADRTIELVLRHGINHFDVAPTYGEAEMRLAPWMPKIRPQIFLATKTKERSRDKAWRQIHDSLRRLHVDQLDLLQLHAITSIAELDQVTQKGGALEALIAAQEQGMVKAIGITGHGNKAPEVHLEALYRYPFDTVLTPLNFVLYAHPDYRDAYNRLVAETTRQDVGLMVIKAIARGPWSNPEPHAYHTWYEPFDAQADIDRSVWYVMAHPEITGFATACDISLLPKILQAVEQYQPLSAEQQNTILAQAGAYASPFGSLI